MLALLSSTSSATQYPAYNWKSCLEPEYLLSVFLLLGYFSWQISQVNLCLYEFSWFIQNQTKAKHRKKKLLLYVNYVKASKPKAT